MDADVEISKPGESSHSVAAKDVKITTTIDTLVKAMYNFHYEAVRLAQISFQFVISQ